MAPEWEPLEGAPLAPLTVHRAPRCRGTGGPVPAHDLQRFAGNMAVGRLLQRQEAGSGTLAPVAEPLDPTGVADALGVYRRQPWLYTREVIQTCGPGSV